MKYAAVLLAILALAGCSTTPGIKAQIAGANIEIAKQRAVAAAKPILDARIPTPHGDMLIVVHAPQGAGSNGQVAMPDDPAWRVAERLVGVVGTTAGIWAGGTAAVSLVQAAGSGIVNALRVQPAPTVITAPDPVIVQPVDPIVVTQPDPIIVIQPEPVIVSPEVIRVDPVFAPSVP